MIKEIRNLLIILLCSALGGTLLLIRVFAFPADAAGAHAEDSLSEMTVSSVLTMRRGADRHEG